MPLSPKITVLDKDDNPVEIPVDEAVSLMAHANGNIAWRIGTKPQGIKVDSILLALDKFKGDE